MMHSALIAAACGFMLVFLSVRIILARHRYRISVGHQNNPALERARRVQANFAEYAPLFLILLAFCEIQGMPAWGVYCGGLLFVAGRIFHFFGFRTEEAPGAFRTLGMALTFGTISILGLILPAQFIFSSIP